MDVYVTFSTKLGSKRAVIGPESKHHLTSVTILRYLNKIPKLIQIHIFDDPEELGYGAVAKLLLKVEETVTTSLVM